MEDSICSSAFLNLLARIEALMLLFVRNKFSFPNIKIIRKLCTNAKVLFHRDFKQEGKGL